MKTYRPLAAAAAAVAIIASVSALATTPAGASVYNGTVEFTCTAVTAAGTGSHVLDRDNTGLGQESLLIEVHDGAGNLLLSYPFSNNLNEFAGGIGEFTYTTPPVANPLSFELTSLAGNGLPEQVDVLVYGTCDELPGTQVTRPPGGLDPVGTTPTTEAPTTTAAPTTAQPTTTMAPPTTGPTTTVAPPTTTVAPTTTVPGRVLAAAAAQPLTATAVYAG